jgi:hypothetical protein
MNITSEIIEKAVSASDDFGHELRVGAILAHVNIPQEELQNIRIHPFSHGGTYTDPVTRKPRQFDYRCRITRDVTKNIFLAVECKNLHPSSPLVISGRERLDQEAYHEFISFGTDGTLWVMKVEGNLWLYKPGEFVGKSPLRVKTTGKNGGDLPAGPIAVTDEDIYEGWAQAVASSYDLVSKAISLQPSKSFVMPLVVVPDGLLWSMCYNFDGTISRKPELVEQCDYFVEKPVGADEELTLTHVRFLTLRGLASMLGRIVQRPGYFWDEIFSHAANRYKRRKG